MNDIEKANSILDAIEILAKKNDSKLSFNKKRKAIIQSLNDDGTVDILINKESYKNIEVRTGLSPMVNEVVRIEIPNNSLKNMYVDTTLKNNFDLLIDDIDGGLFTDDIYTELAIDGGMFIYE